MSRKKKEEIIENTIEQVEDVVLEENKEDIKEVEENIILGSINAKGGLRVREEMNTDCNVVEIIPYQKEIEILEVFEEWVRVSNGYMMKKFIDFKI